MIELAAHRAVGSPARVDSSSAPDLAPALSPASAARVATRRARRMARAGRDVNDVLLLRFRPLFPLFRLWRRWRLGLPLSRRWCAPAMLSSPPSSSGGKARQLKRSPGPAAAHRWRDSFTIPSGGCARGSDRARER
ncbi:MAG TPA: hypothetical protein VFW82_10545 [Dyella sp.]|nr:hypothetical protein [Dyella sp.]